MSNNQNQTENRAKKIGIDATVLANNQEGIGNYVKNVLLNLPKKEQVEYVIYTFATPDDALTARFNQRNDINIRTVREVDGFLSGKRNARNISQSAKKDEVDIMISTHSHLLPIFFKPTAWIVHDISPVTHPEWFSFKGNLFKQSVFNYLFKKGIEAAKKILTISEFIKSEIIANFKVPEKKVQVIGIGPGDVITEAQGLEKVASVKALQQFDLKPEEYFLFLGTLNPRKNIEGLIESYVKYLQLETRSKRPIDALPKLVIAGKKGWLFDGIFNKIKEINKKAPELKLDEKIVFTGFITQQEARALISQSVAFVMPSHYEGFGMPILESLLLGKEVIASDIQVFKENFEGYAHIYNHLDNKDLAKKLGEVYNGARINSQEKQNQLQAKFNWQNVARNLINNILQENA